MDDQRVRDADHTDRPFDPGREPASDVVHGIVSDVLGQFQRFEAYVGLRQRRRRPNDQKTLELTLSAIISDLIHRELSAPGGWVAVPLSKGRLGGTHKARAKALNTMLPSLLERLARPEMGFVEMKKGHRSPFGPGRQTVIRRGPRLLTRMSDHRVGLGDIKRDAKVLPDPLVLRGKKRAGQRGRRCEIPETPLARRYRDEMDQVNAWLAAADLSCDYVGEDGVEITDDARYLRRIFNNGSLEAGGRLFGGFWQRLSKERRLTEVLIEGEPPLALDFGQMAPRIAYSLDGARPPDGDLYRVHPF